jgi:hypothetical protein
MRAVAPLQGNTAGVPAVYIFLDNRKNYSSLDLPEEVTTAITWSMTPQPVHNLARTLIKAAKKQHTNVSTCLLTLNSIPISQSKICKNMHGHGLQGSPCFLHHDADLFKPL